MKKIPHLFPSGRGGFNEYRPNRLSLRCYLSHLLRLSTSRFQLPDFVLYVYDIENRQRLHTTNYIRSIQKPSGDRSVGRIIGGLSNEEIAKTCEYYQICRTQNKANRKIPVVSCNLSHASILFQQNTEKVSGIFNHTDEHTKKNRRKYYSMTYEFGKPTFWFSFNPDVHNNKIVVHLDNGKTYDAVPPSKYRWDLLGSHPGAAALFFKILINNVIRGIFG